MMQGVDPSPRDSTDSPRGRIYVGFSLPALGCFSSRSPLDPQLPQLHGLSLSELPSNPGKL